MLEATVIAIAFFPIGVLYASFAEWAIHKRLMHQPILGIQHFYFGHAKVHHGVYKADDTYVVGDRPPRELTLAWWAMPFPIMLQIPLLAAFALLISLPGMVGFAAALVLYQFSYEYLHYCMHVPNNRWFEGTRWFTFLNEHHLQHHARPNRNLNIVIPLADFLLRTRVTPTESLKALLK